MGGFFSSRSQDPEMLKLATQYKLPRTDAEWLTEHFRDIDWNKDGFVTRRHPALVQLEKGSVNPLIDRVITALFYDPLSLDTEEKPGQHLDLERLFAVSSLFTQQTWFSYFKQLFSRDKEATEQAGERKKMRLMFLFRVFKDPEEAFISGAALEAIVHITNKYYLSEDAKHAVFLKIMSEMREITGRESLLDDHHIEFDDFRKICNHFAIDHIFTEEVRTG